jgi:carboxyl-terminal processing protease
LNFAAGQFVNNRNENLGAMKRTTSLVLTLVLLLGISAFSPVGQRYFEIAKNLDIFASLFKEVNTLYVDEVNPNQLIRTGIDAMLNSLDPYTNYIPEDEVETYRTMNTGQYGGIGAVTRQFGKRVVVSMVYADYPAAKGGLKIGDEIIKMDGIELAKLTMDQSNQLMRGQIGKPVTLTVIRPGQDKPVDLSFKREKIKINNVPYFGMVSDKTGYVTLSDFTVDAAKEVKNAVLVLKDKGATSIVLDLRGNPGGILQEAVAICNIFLPKGKHVVSTRGKMKESNLSYETTFAPVDLDIPVIVLVDRGSASASEIVAGTLQDYDRAVIMGEKSYGKGLVQLSRPLSYNSQVKITTAKYYTPSGRCIQVLDYSHRRPDGSVESVPDSVKKPFKTTNGRIVYDGGGIDPDVALTANETPEIIQVLHYNGLFFDFATEYNLKHPTVAASGQFDITDQEYQEFVSWVKQKDLKYDSHLDKLMARLAEQSKEDQVYADIKAHLDLVSVKIAEARKKDLTTHKELIKSMLAQEIAIRYYFEKGATETRFRYDQELKSALRLVNNPNEYKKILKL